MSFTSKVFLIFFVIVFILYYLFPSGKRWIVLLLSSYIFYGYADYRNVFFLLFVTTVSYVAGRFMDSVVDNRKRKIVLFISVLSLLLLLFVFKYLEWIVRAVYESIMTAPSSISYKLILPIGLSFYVFQNISYIVDVYRQEYNAQKNPFFHATCVSYFPKLLQGPIGKYDNVSKQIKEAKNFEYRIGMTGFYRILIGLFKKVVVANQIARITDVAFKNYTEYTGVLWIIIAFLYTFQIYADFSGYMDIALGTSSLLGIGLEENFDTPYMSRSISEYWRRWHITLGKWFKDYLFYPLLRTKLAGNIRRYFKDNGYRNLSHVLPTVIALAIVWFFTGLWHGANITYICYGLIFGIIIILEVCFQSLIDNWQRKHERLNVSLGFNVFRCIRTYFIVLIVDIIFRSSSMLQAFYIIGNLFDIGDVQQWFSLVQEYKLATVISLFGITVIVIMDVYKRRVGNTEAFFTERKMPIRCVMGIAVILIIYVMGKFDQSSFIYFGF